MVPAVRMTIMIREECLVRDNYVLPRVSFSHVVPIVFE